jgi:hypothetical protein
LNLKGQATIFPSINESQTQKKDLYSATEEPSVKAWSTVIAEPTVYATDARPLDINELVAQQSVSPSVDHLRSLMLECLEHLRGLSGLSPTPVEEEAAAVSTDWPMTGLEDSFECDYSVSTAPTCQRQHDDDDDDDDDGDVNDDVNSDISCNVVIDELVVEVDSDIAVDEDDEVITPMLGRENE